MTTPRRLPVLTDEEQQLLFDLAAADVAEHTAMMRVALGSVGIYGPGGDKSKAVLAEEHALAGISHYQLRARWLKVLDAIGT